MMATNCFEHGITVNNDSVNTGIEKVTGMLTFMASTEQRAYNMPPLRSRGKAKPLVGGSGAKPFARLRLSPRS